MTYIKSFLLLLLFSAVFIACNDNKSSENKSESEWLSLFDSQSFDGWQMYGAEPITDRWAIVDGTIICNQGAGETNTGFRRSIMTNEKFGNFELEMEYKIAKGGNSGFARTLSHASNTRRFRISNDFAFSCGPLNGSSPERLTTG